jgi:hypothetical protein
MEVGCVVLINYGPKLGKLATVIDIVDQNLRLIDGPESVTGVGRRDLHRIASDRPGSSRSNAVHGKGPRSRVEGGGDTLPLGKGVWGQEIVA